MLIWGSDLIISWTVNISDKSNSVVVFATASLNTVLESNLGTEGMRMIRTQSLTYFFISLAISYQLLIQLRQSEPSTLTIKLSSLKIHAIRIQGVKALRGTKSRFRVHVFVEKK